MMLVHFCLVREKTVKNKKIKKLNMLHSWDIEEQESWFTDMSLEGWKLIKINNWFATFEKSEPQKINFRCDIFRLNLKSAVDKIEVYKRSGWEHIGSLSLVQVFREIPGNSYTEVHTDATELAENFSILKRSIHTRGALTILLTLLILILNLAKLQIDPVRNYLDDIFIESIIYTTAYLYVCFTMINGMLHTSKLMTKLKSGGPLEQGIHYKRKMTRNKWASGSIVLILSIWMFTVFSDVFSISNDRFQPIPNGELAVVQISDFMDPSHYKRGEEGRNNYFNKDSSILVPEQYELKQDVIMPNEMWEDGSGTYNPAIRSYLYQIRNEWLAKKFIKHVKEKHSSYHENFEQVNGSNFDELWISRFQHGKSFIARKTNKVYYVIYFGVEPVEEIIDAAFEKANR